MARPAATWILLGVVFVEVFENCRGGCARVLDFMYGATIGPAIAVVPGC